MGVWPTAHQGGRNKIPPRTKRGPLESTPADTSGWCENPGVYMQLRDSGNLSSQSFKTKAPCSGGPTHGANLPPSSTSSGERKKQTASNSNTIKISVKA